MLFRSKTVVATLLGVCAYAANADQQISYQQGVNGYDGALSVIFDGGRHQSIDKTAHYFRYSGVNRRYNIEYFDLGDLNRQGRVLDAKLTFYRVGGWAYTTSDIDVRQILDPDNLGGGYASGWKLAEGFRTGANLESRDDSTGTDIKWRLSDPDSPEDLNADYFAGVLRSADEAPAFSPAQTDAVGSAYTVDVTSDVQCMQLGQCPNHGWALTHASDDANIQYFTGTSHHTEVQYRPQLTITFADDELEPLVLRSEPNGAAFSSTTQSVDLLLETNEISQCRFDRSPYASFEQMQYLLTASADGLTHQASWPNVAADNAYLLYARCQDEAGNTSQTPHVFSFSLNATDTDGGSNEGGSNEGGSNEGGSNEGGSNEGGSNEGGSNEGGSNEGGSNEGGSNEGGTEEPAPAGPGVTLNWQAPTLNVDNSALEGIAGYKIYYGTVQGSPDTVVTVTDPQLESLTLYNLANGEYYFSMKAFSSTGMESETSAEFYFQVSN
ncbi:hypothetical protein [Thalassomonas actiniarum]|uniref:Fibronectin type-III domain-containing protein n=1 Tax=Thalassomonas actiniarum TaxID=485447 RepID=A0AAE9YXZ1_9GAMM|nr:hypothetical protein [Thalassomonas actiniarum]WDE02424.1 hypothetical protein SG35_028850 [Thalassomonas actiniarum]